jgi:hypothetical protein
MKEDSKKYCECRCEVGLVANKEATDRGTRHKSIELFSKVVKK